jgi:hypothetical protein
MAQTIADIQVGDTWVDLNTAAGLGDGAAMVIQNKSPAWVLLYEQTAQPSADTKNGTLLGNMDSNYAVANIASGSLKIWAKSTIAGRPASISVQSA